MIETQDAPTAASAVLVAAREALRAWAASREALAGLELSGLASLELAEVLGAVEVQRRLVAPLDHRLIAEADQRGLAGELGYRDTVGLLAGLLRIDGSEAKTRLQAARDLGPRSAVSGEKLPAVFEATAAAMGAGQVSISHARVITELIQALPLQVSAVHGPQIEASLVEHAPRFAPRELRILARRLRESYDPDGRLASDADRARHRQLNYRQHPDGSLTGSFATDAVTGEALLTYLDATAKPVTDGSGSPDARSATQRRHDALSQLLLRAISRGLPDSGGVTTTIMVTLSAEQLLTGQGLGTTGHGALISAGQLRRLIGNARLHPVALDPNGAVIANGTSPRVHSENQRLGLIARDQGCSFPGCTIPASWCETHHIVPYAEGGPTEISNGTLLCGYHHAHFEQLGWQCESFEGLPRWIPPIWIDPTRTPQRNNSHTPDI